MPRTTSKRPPSSRSSTSTLLMPFWKLITSAPSRPCSAISRAASAVAPLFTARAMTSTPASAVASVRKSTSRRWSCHPWQSLRVSPCWAMSRAKLGRPMKVTGSPAACQQPPMKQPTDPAPRTAILSATTIGGDALVWQPQALGGLTRLPEDVDGNPAARVPVSADPQPSWLHLFGQALADPDRHVLVEAAMVAKGAEEQLEALALHDRLAGRIVDHQVREVRLAGHRAERGEFRRREPHQVERARLRVRHIIEHRLFGRSGQGARCAEMRRVHRARFLRFRKRPVDWLQTAALE